MYRVDSGLYISPENAYLSESGRWALHPLTPDNVDDYLPDIDSSKIYQL